MLNHKQTAYMPISMIADVFVKGKINLLYGESGCGKTYSTLKALNSNGITPILLDLDNNLPPEEIDLQFEHLNGVVIVKKFMKNNDSINIVSDSVVIIDTWQMFASITDNDISFLEALKAKGNTIIVIAHAKDIATKKDIVDMESSIANHMDCKLFLERRKSSVDLIIKKLRGYTGPMTITNWMRPKVISTKTKSK
jgi:hypothetical protein